MHPAGLRAALLLLCLVPCCSAQAEAGLPVVPRPAQATMLPGRFVVPPRPRIVADGPVAGSAAAGVAAVLAEALRRPIAIARTRSGAGPSALLLTTRGAPAGLGAEGYTLAVTPTGVVARARTAA